MRKLYLLKNSVVSLCYLLGISGAGIAQVTNTQSFDGTFAPAGWTNAAVVGTSVWNGVATGTNPTIGTHSGAGMARWNAYSIGSNNSANLVTPVIDWSGLGSNTATLSFWWVRDVSAYNSATYDNEGITIWVNTAPNTTGATQIGFLPRRGGQTATGMTSGPATTTTTGWQNYTFDIPTSFNGATNYIIFQALSKFGNNCFLDDVTWISYPPLTATLTAAQNPLLCNGNETSVYSQITGGTPPFFMEWSTGDTASGSTDTVHGLTAGTYTVIVTDDEGEHDTTEITLTEPTAITSTITVLQELTCNYDLGAAEVEASGGTPSSTNYIQDISGTFAPDVSSAGTNVILSDDAVSAALPIGFNFTFFGNTYSNFYISSNGFVSFENTGNGCCTGQLLPTAGAPNNLIALAWEDLNPGSGANGTINYYTIGSSPNQVLVVNFINVPHFGTSTATVTIQLKLFETTNCIEIHTTNMTPDAAVGQTQGIENANGTIGYWYPGRNSDATWVGNQDMITFCPDPYSGYLWSSGEVTPEADELVAGMNYVTVTDGNGCDHVDSVYLDPASNLVSNTVFTDVTCYSYNDGTIDPVITGGIVPYVYNWSNSETGTALANLGPGVYSGTVTDALNCTLDIAPVTIHEPDLLISSVTSITHVVCENDPTGAATIITQGGVPPYTYNWTPGGYTTNSVTDLTDGIYSVQVLDANLCATFSTVGVLAANELPEVDLGPDILNTAGDTITLAPMSNNYTSFLWSNNSNNSSINVTQTGTYWLEVTNDGGCVATDTIYVEIWPTGVSELSDLEVKMYPNPASTSFTIEMPSRIGEFEVSVMDIKGSVIFQQAYTNGGNKTIDLSQWSSGVYTVSITSDGNQLMKTRLVKGH